MKNLIEHYRQEVIEDIFKLQSVQKVWPIWKNLIQKKLTNLNPENIFNLGDELRDIMFSTNKGRNQSSQSAGGNAWEFFVCWYLNLCLVGSKSVVVKFKKKFIPEVIKDAIAVNYSNFTTNTESDLMAITFSDKINLKEESFNLKKLNSTLMRIYQIFLFLIYNAKQTGMIMLKYQCYGILFIKQRALSLTIYLLVITIENLVILKNLDIALSPSLLKKNLKKSLKILLYV